MAASLVRAVDYGATVRPPRKFPTIGGKWQAILDSNKELTWPLYSLTRWGVLVVIGRTDVINEGCGTMQKGMRVAQVNQQSPGYFRCLPGDPFAINFVRADPGESKILSAWLSQVDSFPLDFFQTRIVKLTTVPNRSLLQV